MDMFRLNEWYSGDGVDASIIKTNGIDHYETILDKYFEYDTDIYIKIFTI